MRTSELDAMEFRDNRTTELREKLTERGVEHEARDGGTLHVTSWLARGVQWNYREIGDTHSLTMGNPWVGCTPEQAIAATLGSEREAKLIRAMEDVLRHATDTVWVSEIETLVDRMVSLGVYGCEVYEGARPWEVD